MFFRRSSYLAVLALVGSVALTLMSASACTGIRIRPGDGSIIYARTLEFGVDLRSNIVVIPRGKAFVGTTAGGKPGLTWTTTYGFVGMNAFGLPAVADGLNEKGLAVGVFYFPGSAKYQPVTESEVHKSLAPQELAGYLLGTCANVSEAVNAATRLRVGEVVFDKFGFVPPVHFIAHDASGRCVVLEHVDGELKVHDNPLGVMSNSPTFDWHVTNLRNYVNLSVTSVPPVDLSGERLASFGQGSGMLGLPGDFTPPSRFVRAVAFSNAAVRVGTARDGVLQAFHILNQFDIPKGASRAAGHGNEAAEYTLWTTAADLTNLRYYFHTYESRRIRMIDLKELDLNARDMKAIPITEEEAIEDVTRGVKSLRP